MKRFPIIAIAVLSALGGCTTNRCFDAVLAQPPRSERFAFIASDFTSSALGLLDNEGGIINPPLIDSGSVPPGALTALSGDVVLATEQPGDRLLYIERLGADLITAVSRKAWFVEQQSRTSQLGNAGNAFNANPQDVLPIGADRYWVTRHNPNTEAGSGPTSGNDIAVISRPDGLIFDHISLAVANTILEGDVIYARPGRMTFVPSEGNPTTGTAAVGLTRLSEDFMVAGPGAIALINTLDTGVTIMPLDPLTNCGELRAVPDKPKQVVVVCKGSPFMRPEERRVTAGLALIDVEEQRVLQLWTAAAHPEVLPPQHGVIPLGNGQVAVVGLSEGSERTEIESQLIGIDLFTGNALVIATSIGEQLGFGAGAYDPQTRMLLVPDSNRTETNLDTIRRFEYLNGLLFAERIIQRGFICEQFTIREIALLSPRLDE